MPASYLAAFTVERTKLGSLWVYDRLAPTKKRCLRPRDVALEKNLYIRPDEHGRPDDSIERFFAESLEGPFALIRNLFVYGADLGLNASLSTLTRAERKTVARFLAFQLLRTPSERDATRWLGTLTSIAHVREHLQPEGELRQQLEQAIGAPLNQQQLAGLQKLLTGMSQLQSPINDWLPRTLRIAERLAPLLARLEWRLVKVPADVELVTCDMPLVCVRRGSEPGSFELGGAVAEPAFEATLTLAPSHVLYVTHRVADEAFLLTEEFAQSVRRRTIAYAQRWVYSRKEDEEIGPAFMTSPTPSYYIAFNGRIFRMGHSVEEIERTLRNEGVTQFRFGYGVPAS